MKLILPSTLNDRKIYIYIYRKKEAGWSRWKHLLFITHHLDKNQLALQVLAFRTLDLTEVIATCLSIWNNLYLPETDCGQSWVPAPNSGPSSPAPHCQNNFVQNFPPNLQEDYWVILAEAARSLYLWDRLPSLNHSHRCSFLENWVLSSSLLPKLLSLYLLLSRVQMHFFFSSSWRSRNGSWRRYRSWNKLPGSFNLLRLSC